MPASKAKSANGPAAGKSAKGVQPNAVPPSPVPQPSEKTGHPSANGSGRPDKNAYEAEQERLKSEIDALQANLDVLREKITLASKPSGNDRRNALRAELDSIRERQSSYKSSRSKILDQLKTLQDGIQKKGKDLQAARSKTPFRTVAEVDAHIQNLEKQVESGSMKLADEKRALQEISQVKRTRRAVEGFQAIQDSIDAERNAADELRQQLDDPESKAVSDRYDKIKAELDELKRESDEAYAGRSKLVEERDNLQAEINSLFNKKRECAQQFREATDRYWAKVNEDRARRAERARAQRAAEEAQKKLEHAQRLREEASLPAYQVEIEDCQTLIDVLSGKSSSTVVPPSASLPTKGDVAGVPKLELRQVEASNDGLVARKKKGEGEETYFVGKGKRGRKDKTNKTTQEMDTLKNLSFTTIAALSKLAIPLPAGASDIPRVVEDLKAKKAWYEANRTRVTAENIAKVEAQIERLTSAAKQDVENRQVTVDSNGGDMPIESEPKSVESKPDCGATSNAEAEVDE